MSSISIARWILILGTVFVFMYFGIEKFTNAIVWIGWMPDWMDGLLGFSIDSWLQIIGVSEIVIAIMVLVPVRILQKAGALLASLHLVGILTQVGWNETAVRDIGLLSMTVSLWYLI